MKGRHKEGMVKLHWEVPHSNENILAIAHAWLEDGSRPRIDGC